MYCFLLKKSPCLYDYIDEVKTSSHRHSFFVHCTHYMYTLFYTDVVCIMTLNFALKKKQKTLLSSNSIKKNS